MRGDYLSYVKLAKSGIELVFNLKYIGGSNNIGRVTYNRVLQDKLNEIMVGTNTYSSIVKY